MPLVVEGVQQHTVKPRQLSHLPRQGVTQLRLGSQPAQLADKVRDHPVHHLGADQPVLQLKFQNAPAVAHAMTHHAEELPGKPVGTQKRRHPLPLRIRAQPQQLHT